MHIDLHHLTVNEALETFIIKYNEIYKSGYKGEIELIHGYGSSGKGGKIKKEIRKLIEANKSSFRIEYNNNPGITILLPKKPIPPRIDMLSKDILNFCKDNGKSLSKIESKFFRKYKVEDIKKSIRYLLRVELLKEETGKKERIYIKK